MIDPARITDYDRSTYKLQELLLFCIGAAGKNANTIARALDTWLRAGRFCTGRRNPFDVIRALAAKGDLAEGLKIYGFGCYTLKAKGFVAAATSGLNLRTCTVEQLEALPGIGPKTARFFILHTRRGARVACLDVHILRWLQQFTSQSVPTQTPSGRKYIELEQLFLSLADKAGLDPAALDLQIWRRMRSHDDDILRPGDPLVNASFLA